MKSVSYEEFVKKFTDKPKTTDDCYTPPAVYSAVVEYFTARYSLTARNIVRPFYPGGDYQAEDYEPGDVVIDNPPFSILQQIIDWYNEHGVDFVLFAPGLMHPRNCRQICPGFGCRYQNGAVINTSFVTNFEPDGIESAPLLLDKLRKAQPADNKQGTHDYNREVCTAARAGTLARHGIRLSVDGPKTGKHGGQAIYGGGVVMNDEQKAAMALAMASILNE